AGIRGDVPESLEHVVTGIVGNPQRSIIEHTDEAGLASAMGRIGAGSGVHARNEKRVGALDGEPLLGSERRAVPGAPLSMMAGIAPGRARLDVLRAVAEDLLGSDLYG